MLSRGSGTLLDSRNMVMQDWEGTPVTRAGAVGRTSLVWSNSSAHLLCVPERSNATQWAWLLGDRRAISWPGSGTRCSAVPYVPAKFLHRQPGSEAKRRYVGMAGVEVGVTSPHKKGSLTLQMTSRCLLVEKELSCRQWSTSSCQRLHFTWKSVNVCAPPGWRKTAECSHVSASIYANGTSALHQHNNWPIYYFNSRLGFHI